MGSGISKNKILKCPKNYDKDKFKKILLIFDELDKDGNHALDND